MSETLTDMLHLYHRTSIMAYHEIMASGRMTSSENTDEAYFSNRREGQAEGYGTAVVHVFIPDRLARLDDEFPDGEQHFRVLVSDLRPEHFIP